MTLDYRLAGGEVTWYMHLAAVYFFFLSLSLLARVICAMIAAIPPTNTLGDNQAYF